MNLVRSPHPPTVNAGDHKTLVLYRHDGTLVTEGSAEARGSTQDTGTPVWIGNGENQKHHGWIAAAEIRRDIAESLCMPDDCPSATEPASWSAVKTRVR